MIRFNLRKMLEKLEEMSQRKITLKEVSEQSGCDKNALSRLVNHPSVMPSARVIDDLIQYLFHSMKKLRPDVNESVVMKEVIQDFISVFPDDPDYWEHMPEHIQENPYEFPIELLWEIHGNLKLTDSPRTKPLSHKESDAYIRKVLAKPAKPKSKRKKG